MNYIIGKIVYKGINFIIIDNNFIGHKIFVSGNSDYEIDKYRKIYIYKKITILNNNIIEDLYGFEKIKDRLFFERLMTISGIGPKTAMLILANNVDQLKYLIKNNKIDELSKLKNISKKIATLLVSNLEINEDVDFGSSSVEIKNSKEDIISALQVLGYRKDIINETLDRTFKPNDYYFKNEEDLTNAISFLIKEISKNIDNESK